MAEPSGVRDHTVVEVSRTPHGPAGARLRHGALRGQVVGRDAGGVHVVLLPTRALLLSGDEVSLGLRVGPGCRLDVTEPSGTVAYDMTGAPATWHVDVDVAPGGLLVWHAAPFVVSGGARVHRRTRVRLAGDGRCLLRETLVLGRHGEGPGRLGAATTVERDGRPLWVEEWSAGPESQTPGILGAHRVVDQVLDLGPDAVAQDPRDLELAAGGVVHRRLAGQAHLASLEDTWRALVAGTRVPPEDSGRIAV